MTQPTQTESNPIERGTIPPGATPARIENITITDTHSHKSRYDQPNLFESLEKEIAQKLGIENHQWEINTELIGLKAEPRQHYGWRHSQNQEERSDLHTKSPFFMTLSPTQGNWREPIKTLPEPKAMPESLHFLSLKETPRDRDRYYYGHHRSVNFASPVGGKATAFFLGFKTESGETIYVTGEPSHLQKLYDIKLTDDFRFVIGDNISCDAKSILDDSFSKFSLTIRSLSTINSQLHFVGENFLKLAALASKTQTLEEAKGSSNEEFEASLKKKGIVKTYQKLAPIADKLYPDNIVALCVFRSFAAHCHKSANSIKLSTVFNKVFADVKDEKDIVRILKPILSDEEFWAKTCGEGNRYWGDSEERTILQGVENLEGYKDKRRKVLRSQTDRAFSKLMQEFSFLDLDEKKYPILTAAIHDGDIPLTIFFRKKEQYFLFNDNFALWEEMLKKHRDVTIEIAKAASTRSTYEKDLMSYFYFVLHGLPKYLKKHTKRKWTCSPKFVSSASELDPPKEGDDGVARKRSALTPIVDNEAGTVAVPYAALQMHGRQTTYCYSYTYCALQEGFSFNGNTITNDLEEKLNGRDDYGLMFYTLTGSPTTRGYPTFLIIFERRSDKTWVHFHRVHPSRSKDGDYNPIHNWTKVCYNWMAGNVRAERIVSQQGDLIFVADEVKKVDFNKRVTKYDNHNFEKPVWFSENTNAKKKDLLGYANITEDTMLLHNEHEDVLIPAGTYAVRQCRSWEANPKGIWTINID